MNNDKAIRSLFSLKEVFNDRKFIIPDYQRGFSWENRQLTDLKKDLEKLLESDNHHYTGTIVITKKDVDPFFQIVDGQQRLTSLVILLRVIYELDKKRYKNLLEQFFLVGSIGSEIQKLNLGNDNNSFFLEVILENVDKHPLTKSQERILNAKKFFREWLSKEEFDLDALVDVIVNKLGFILYEPKHSSEIGIMFEVINNRGKLLSELEKIKNYFIYFSTINNRPTLKELINQKWAKILTNLNHAQIDSLDEENAFLRYCYLVYYDPSKSRSWNIYEEIKGKYDQIEKDNIEAAMNQIKGFVNFLETGSEHYAFLLNKTGFFNTQVTISTISEKKRLDTILTKLRCHPVNASIMPLYLSIFNRISNYQNQAKVIDLLEIIEILNFRLYILPKVAGRADSKQSDLFKLAFDFFRNPQLKSENDKSDYFTPFLEQKIEGDIFNWLAISIKDYIKKVCPEQKFVQALTLDVDEYDDYYNWVGLRYFLASYEKYLQKEEHDWDIQNILKDRRDVGHYTNDFLSKEHIWARKNLTPDYPPDHIEKRRLGNFVLVGLSKNIQLSDNDIPDKIEELKENNSGELRLYQIEELTKIYEEADNYIRTEVGRVNRTRAYYEDLAKKINDIRENRVIKFALANWKLPEEKFNNFIKVDSFDARQNKKEKYFFLDKD